MFWRYLCSYIVLLLKYWSTPIVFTLSLLRGDCHIPLIQTHCFSNVSTERTELITLLSILDLIQLADWAVLPLLWKHIHYFPTGGNIVVVCKFNKLTDVAAICCAWWFGVELVVMLKISSLLFHKTACYNYLWCLIIMDGIFGTQTRIYLLFVSNRRDISYCWFNTWWCVRS